jgi:hypothetical protein
MSDKREDAGDGAALPPITGTMDVREEPDRLPLPPQAEEEPTP